MSDRKKSKDMTPDELYMRESIRMFQRRIVKMVLAELKAKDEKIKRAAIRSSLAALRDQLTKTGSMLPLDNAQVALDLHRAKEIEAVKAELQEAQERVAVIAARLAVIEGKA